MSYLREAIEELVEELETDTLVSMSEAVHNTRFADRLNRILIETERLDDE